MKKTGFTLAELLITLAIIGVVVAFLIPAINHLKPDTNKIMYLKAYDTLSATIKSLASNSQIYPACNQEHNMNCYEHPLMNTESPLMSPLNNNELYKGNVKFCNLLALSFGISESAASCSTDTYDYADNTFKNNLSFFTKNGMQWKIVQQVYSISDEQAQFQADIYVDINGNKEPNCLYSENCKNPDIFKFMVAANGTIVPADPMGKAYIASRKTFTKKELTIGDDDNVLISLDDKVKNFAYTRCQESESERREREKRQCELQGKYWYQNACNNLPSGYYSSDSDEFCHDPTMVYGGSNIPNVRSDGYFHNLRETDYSGIFVELFNPDGGCNDYNNLRYYMYDPETETFEELDGMKEDLMYNDYLMQYDVFRRLNEKSKPPYTIYGKEYKMAQYGNNAMLDENGNVLPQNDGTFYIYYPH